MALRFKSVRGLYVGGGIAPKILQKLKDGTFMRSFIDKGRYTELLAAMPVQVVLNPQAGLRGAGYYAPFLSGEYLRRCQDTEDLARQGAAQFVSVATKPAA